MALAGLELPGVTYGSQDYRWPGGKKIAVWIVPNVEWFDVNAPIPGGSQQAPNVLGFSARDYGSRVGFFRIADVLDGLRIRASVALNSAVCDTHPQIVSRIKSSNWEIVAHNVTNSQRLVGLTMEEERRQVEYALDTIESAFGSRPRGWLSSGLQESSNSLRLLTEAGVDYVCDWILEDQPVLLQHRGGTIYSLPYTVEIADKRIFEQEGNPCEEFVSRAIEQFDVLSKEGETVPRVMAISVHPYLIGQPHRIEALRRVLTYIRSSPDAWIATGSEILDEFKAAFD